jgi:hypothetical protein
MTTGCRPRNNMFRHSLSITEWKPLMIQRPSFRCGQIQLILGGKNICTFRECDFYKSIVLFLAENNPDLWSAFGETMISGLIF